MCIMELSMSNKIIGWLVGDTWGVSRSSGYMWLGHGGVHKGPPWHDALQ